MMRTAAIVLLSAAAFAAKPAPKPKTAPLTPEQRAAQTIVKRMSLTDQVAQLVIVVCYGDTYSTKSPEFQRYRHLVADLHIGGLIVNNSTQYGLVRYAEPHAMVVFLNQMQRLAKTPLIVAGDFERSSSMRVTGGARFPYAMAFGAAGDPDNARFEGATAAREARALGVHWLFAPVADVNVNPENPVINVRSYGEDPDQVSRLITAFIDGAHSDPANRVLVTVKHFPGHGDTASNSHVDLPELAATRERIDAVEFKPFAAAIEHQVDSVMIAHMTVPAIDSEGLPATLSPAVIATLRDDLKFPGLIVTDAMDMAGVLKQFSGADGAVRAIAAGEDVLLMPPDPERAIRAVVAAVNGGRISRSRIEQSAIRIMAAKIRVGLMKKKLTDVDAITDNLDSPEATQRAQHISDQAVTLVKNDAGLLPLDRQSRPCLVVMREARASTTGLRLAQEFQARAPAAKVFVVDSGLPLVALEATVADASTCSALVVETSITGSDSRTSMTLAGDLGPFVENLTNGPIPVALVSLGSPYVIASFPKSAAYLATFSPTVPSEIAAAKALFGDIPIQGHLPVTIPGFAKLGDGIQLPARSR
jgi:beta-N-acetylhexosaminidase